MLLALTLAAAVPTIDCRDARRARSTGTVPIEHAFQNGWHDPMTLWWIDERGQRMNLGVLAPGAAKQLTTTVGHVFVLTNAKGRCRALIRAGDGDPGSYVGTSRYRAVPVPGWRVFIDQSLDADAEPARAALAVIAAQLRAIEGAVPAAALVQLRQTPIYLHGGAGYGGQYHYSADWLAAHGRTVELVNAIEISDAASFVAVDAPVQLWALLHELAHGYHWQLSPAEKEDIAETYRRAMAAGRYRRVARHDGSVGPAYGANNAQEYFAELSEAWFGRNDFAPFTRAELAAFDPDGAALMARIWR